jgi:hypothetical protein
VLAEVDGGAFLGGVLVGGGRVSSHLEVFFFVFFCFFFVGRSCPRAGKLAGEEDLKGKKTIDGEGGDLKTKKGIGERQGPCGVAAGVVGAEEREAWW